MSWGRTIEIPSLPLFFRPPWEEDAVMQEFSSSFSLQSVLILNNMDPLENPTVCS